MTTTQDIANFADQWQAGKVSLSWIRREIGEEAYKSVQAELVKRGVGTFTAQAFEAEDGTIVVQL